jgi:hypothetical protein
VLILANGNLRLGQQIHMIPMVVELMVVDYSMDLVEMVGMWCCAI